MILEIKIVILIVFIILLISVWNIEKIIKWWKKRKTEEKENE